jgi:hypothetical protein
LKVFLVCEISSYRRSIASLTDLSVSVRLRFHELKILQRRLSALNQTALHSVNKVFIRVSMQRLLFQDPSGYDDWTPKFLNDSAREFSDFSATLIRGFCQLIEQRYPAPPSPTRAKYIQLIESTLYIELVDRINVDKFGELRWVFPTMNKMAEDQGRVFQDLCARAEMRTSVIAAATELLSGAMCRCPFSKMIHSALRTVAIIAAALPKDCCTSEVITAAIAACFVQSRPRETVLQYLVLWGFFVQWFFPYKNHLLDLIGGRDGEGWAYFESLFQRVRAITPPHGQK